MLSPNQRNYLFKAVEQQKLNARDFKIEPTEEQVKVTHRPTGFYFRFYPTDVKTNAGPAIYFFLYFTPSRQGAIFSAKKEDCKPNIDTLERALPHFNNWLAVLREEFEQPDLWADLENTPDFFTESENLPEDAFTPAEIKLLEGRIAHVEQQILDLNLPTEVEEAITKAVREVPQKAKRLTKKEMGEILFNSVMREGFKAVLSKENMLAVWHLILHLFTLTLHQ